MDHLALPAFWPFPITTDRLLIRPRISTDSEMVFKAIQESFNELREWMPWAKSPDITLDYVVKASLRAEEGFRAKTEFTFSILDRDEKFFIGGIGLQAPILATSSFNIAYWLNSNCTGQGLMTEAANALCRYCFEVLNAQSIESHCAVTNKRSLALISRLGFKVEKILEKYEAVNDGPSIDCLLAILRNPANLPALSVTW